MKKHIFSLSVAAVLAAAVSAISPAYATAQPGTVVDSRPFQHALPLNATARVISYQTQLEDGTPTVATATVYEPTAAWRGKGPRPTVVFPPGTRGQGDQCAPSRAHLGIGSVTTTPAGVSLNINYEYQLYQYAAAKGMRVVAPDLIGLGTPGHHTYVNTREQAQAVLDAARAAVPAGHPVGFAGYSQGGGAAAAAGEYAGLYAPELNVKGTYAGAAPASLMEVMKAVDGSMIVHVLGYALNGFGERNPELLSAISENFNERGQEFLRTAAQSCVADSALTWGGTRTSELTKTGESFYDLAMRLPAIRQVLESQKLGVHKPNAPMYIATSPNDDITPYPQAQALAGDYCRQGATVLFHATPGTNASPGSAVPHSHPFFHNIPQGLDYLEARFNDQPAPSNCVS